MSDDVVIRVENLWKRYGTTVGAELKRLLSFRRNSPGAPVDDGGPWALRDINFEVRRGETLGIIGRNGAGKSTLLKVLAGVTPPTYGNIEMRGRIFPMIELNAGMHFDLTGRQNVHLLGAVMGFPPQEMQDRMPEIEAFCELGEWFDRPVWMYSSGMLARLGFAVAVNVNADILVVDEVLAVGDLSFQRKCFAKMDALYRSGVSLVFVSHSLRMVERLCPRAIYLDQGRVVGYGPTADVITQYQLDSSAELLEKKSAQAVEAKPQASQPERVVRIRQIELLDGASQVTNRFHTGEPMTIRVYYDSEVEVIEPNIGIGITQETVYITGFTNELHNDGTVLRKGIGMFECHIPRLLLLSGVYSISIKFRAADGGVLGGDSNLVYFSVQTPAEIRRSHEYGYVVTDVMWQV